MQSVKSVRNFRRVGYSQSLRTYGTTITAGTALNLGYTGSNVTMDGGGTYTYSYSTNDGTTWTKINPNPVISSTTIPFTPPAAGNYCFKVEVIGANAVRFPVQLI